MRPRPGFVRDPVSGYALPATSQIAVSGQFRSLGVPNEFIKDQTPYRLNPWSSRELGNLSESRSRMAEYL